MNMTNNSVLSKPFLKSLFFTQNKWHQHGVLLHTLRVTYYALKHGDFKFIGACLLHDVGKPFTAFVKDNEDIEFNEYSFTDHEERSYQIIKDWAFVSDYTKTIVRYHYLIRDIKNSRSKDIQRHDKKKKIWDELSHEIKADLLDFLRYDDLGKGKSKR
ncbi:HD domain-containing protein [Sulfurimonas sp.]|nr:HD domain-containing protein [Sulfurimonas sp.]